MTNKQIKTLARIKLKGNWGNSIALTFCIIAVMLLIFLVGYFVICMNSHLTGEEISLLSYLKDPVHLIVTLTAAIVVSLVLSMVYFVIVRQVIDISKGLDFSKKRNAIYRRPLKLVQITVIPQLVRFFIIVLAAVPGLFALDFAKRLSEMAGQTSITFLLLFCFMVSMLAMILSLILVVACILSLHLLPAIIMLHPGMGLFRAIRLCFKAADSNRLRMLFFYLSFVKFVPLLLLVYPAVVIIPYYAMSDIVLISTILDDELKKDEFFTVFPPCNPQDENPESDSEDSL